MRIVFIADEFKLRTPVQQLLDRFLVGYPNAGMFHKPACQTILVAPEKNADIERRIEDFGLQWQSTLAPADAAMIFNRGPNVASTPRPFVYGAPVEGVPSGTAVRGAWLLPNLSVSKGIRVRKGLAIVQGAYPTAEIEALDALLPLIAPREVKVRSVTRLSGNDLWDVLKRDFWPLVKAAISRSDSPQGDPVRDGRTQDLVGLALIEGLVKSPRGWLIEHDNGFQYVIAVMDGALADYNVALQTATGGIMSAQVHRPPAPGEHHYSRLAAMLERYFITGTPPWPQEQCELVRGLLERFESIPS